MLATGSTLCALAFLSLGLCLVGFVTNTGGYSFRQGQQAPISPQDFATNANPEQAVPLARQYKAYLERAEPSARATGQGGVRCMIPIVFIRR